MRFPLPLAAAVAALALAAPLAGQDAGAPPRPHLTESADTNSALAYFTYGLSRIRSRPADAADAFYWAARLNPALADAHYGRYAALLLRDERRLVGYMDDDRRTMRRPEIQEADSAFDRALVLDPLLYRRFDRDILETYFEASAVQSLRRRMGAGHVDRALIAHWIQQWLQTAPASWKGWMAYGNRDFPEAIRQYERAVDQARSSERWRLRADLGRSLYLARDLDRAVEQLSQAVQEWRRDDDRMVYVYMSKALLEHSIGVIEEQRGDLDAAREAFGRALQEDLSYHPAHVGLARVALAQGDTATALSELDLAVQIRGDDAALRHQYGAALADARRYMEAMEQFRAATEHEPYFAAPYLMIGKIYDASGLRTEAMEQYAAYAERAPRSDGDRRWAEQRLAVLERQIEAERAAYMADQDSAGAAEPAGDAVEAETAPGGGGS